MPGVMSGCGRSMWGRIRRRFFDGPVALLRLALLWIEVRGKKEDVIRCMMFDV